MPRKLLFSVSIKDCVVDTFTCGGKGGSGKDTSNNGVRVRHLASGAVGEARDSREQLRNKRAAFQRMAESTVFKTWVRLEAARLASGKTVEEQVEEELAKKNLKIERKTPLGWEVWNDDGKPEVNPLLCRRCQYRPIATRYWGQPLRNESKLCHTCMDDDAHQDYMRSPG
jgi:hypothetical protein